ncbi:MAG: NAD(P)-dependent oxidoreductase [Chloroflexota bacterium]
MIDSVEALDNVLAEPTQDLVDDLARLDGDLLILGVGGKMGPSLARLAVHAGARAGQPRRVIGVSRFSSGEAERLLRASGVETICADLLDDEHLRALPEVRNVIYMAGTKFGTRGQEALTWTMNAYLPGRVAEKYRQARIVSFSTGNVYPFASVRAGGATEDAPTGPLGDYAQSCLGRERVFDFFAARYAIPMVHLRLNYAIDLRYGVLLDIARAVAQGQPIDLRMGAANVIWQGDANAVALRCLTLCSTPPRVLNVTGPETVSVRWLACRFGELLGREPLFAHEEQDTALLSNAARCHELFGYPRVTLGEMISWTAHWVSIGGETLDKPTLFSEREGVF